MKRVILILLVLSVVGLVAGESSHRK